MHVRLLWTGTVTGLISSSVKFPRLISSKDWKRVTLLFNDIFHLGIQKSISPVIVGKTTDHFGMFCYVIKHQVLTETSRFKMGYLKTVCFSLFPFDSTTHSHQYVQWRELEEGRVHAGDVLRRLSMLTALVEMNNNINNNIALSHQQVGSFFRS